MVVLVASSTTVKPAASSLADDASSPLKESRSNVVLLRHGDSSVMRITEHKITEMTPRMLGNERGAKLHIANGAYPVYYSIARVNGRFGKHIRAYDIDEFNSANKL